MPIPHKVRNLYGVVLLAAGCLYVISPAGSGNAAAISEQSIKAAYLFNFAKFVEWPAAPSEAFCIGIYGENSLKDELQTMLTGKTIQDRPLSVRQVYNPEDASRCQVLYISPQEPHQLQYILENLKGAPVLTVGDNAKFVNQGGMVGFRKLRNRVRFDINLRAANAAHLKISSQLLKIANSVKGTPEPAPGLMPEATAATEPSPKTPPETAPEPKMEAAPAAPPEATPAIAPEPAP